MPDYGGANDGQCEWSFFSRCTEDAVVTVTFGQHGGWTYNYCGKHGAAKMQEKLEDEEWERQHG